MSSPSPRRGLLLLAVWILAILAVLRPWQLLREPWGLRAAPPEPGWSSASRDWLALAAAIANPEDLRPFEPMLEELTGEAPLGWQSVVMGPRSATMSGQYSAWHIELLGAEDPARRELRYACPELPACGGMELCAGREAQPRVGALKGRLLATWIHEQGHHLGRVLWRWPHAGPERRWLEQVEAEALVFAFAEHVGRHYSQPLAAHLLAQRLRPVTDPTMHLKPEARERLASRLPWPDPDEKGGWVAAVLALRASGLPDFASVWRFVHAGPAAQVLRRIRESVGRVDEGHRQAIQELFRLEGGAAAGTPGDFVAALPEPEELGEPEMLPRGECLELRYPRYSVSFCDDGMDARIDFAEHEGARQLLRLSTNWLRSCLVVQGRDPAGQDGWLVVEGRRAALRSISAIESPCLCASDERLLSFEEAVRRLDELGPRLDALLALAVEHLRRFGEAGDRRHAFDVVRRLTLTHGALGLGETERALARK